MTRTSFLIFQTCTMDGDIESADDGMRQAMKTGVGRVRAPSIRFRYLFVLATFCGTAFVLFTIRNGSEFTSFNANNHAPHHIQVIHRDHRTKDDFTIKTEGCTIPLLRPFDPSIKQFIYPPHIKPCLHAKNPLLENNNTHIWIVTENFSHFNVGKTENVTCCYKAFYRPLYILNIASDDVDNRVKYDTCMNFSSTIEVENEFVRVTCFLNQTNIYEQFFLFAQNKTMVVLEENGPISPPNNSYNVIILGIDAVSRLNFHRTMPKTLAFLKKKGSIELNGYNKVGDNTFPNLTPMLLGLREDDLKKTCWPNTKSTFDNCPFIWDWYKEKGFFTALGEDSAFLGTFNFGKIGFTRTPTDYYLHTFINEAEVNVGNNKDFNTVICMGNKYFYKVLLDYIEHLAETLRGSRLFGFFWEVTMSHDFLNYPKAMDDNYEIFLKNLDDLNYLEDTVMFILSDHGMRWGDIRSTKQGRLEERLPLVHVLVPQSFRDTYPLAYNNLKINSRRLTTPFDIHATLSDLINLDVIRNENIKLRSKAVTTKERNISLFLPTPKNRTCESAGIEKHWCTCIRGKKILREGKEAQKVALQLVKQLNYKIRNYMQCAELVLDKVLEVTELVAGEPDKNETGWREYMAVVQVMPSGGIFEATLRRYHRNWNLAGTISRLNLYGSQSECVQHYQLKLYCYCIF